MAEAEIHTQHEMMIIKERNGTGWLLRSRSSPCRSVEAGWDIFICRFHGTASQPLHPGRHWQVTNTQDEQIEKLAEQIYIVCLVCTVAGRLARGPIVCEKYTME